MRTGHHCPHQLPYQQPYYNPNSRNPYYYHHSYQYPNHPHYGQEYANGSTHYTPETNHNLAENGRSNYPPRPTNFDSTRIEASQKPSPSEEEDAMEV